MYAGNVVAGSLFATLQSAGMAGYGAATMNVLFQGIGVITTFFGIWGTGRAEAES
jgi:Interferon-induced 6-16 family